MPTRHTHERDGLPTRNVRKCTHTNTQLSPTKYDEGSRRGGRLAPTPSELHLGRDLPRRRYVQRHREALCLQREPSRRRPAHFMLVLPLGQPVAYVSRELGRACSAGSA